MSKKITLSKKQKEVVKYMQRNVVIKRDNGWWLHDGEHYGPYVSPVTIVSLRKKGLIDNKGKGADFDFDTLIITDLGISISIK